jgi:feruloyl esterase
MTHLKSTWLRGAALAVLAVLATPGVGSAQEPPRPIDTSAYGQAGADCAELRYGDFSTVEDAITQITDARPFPGVNGGPAFCQVEGYIWRATRFRLRYPLSGWNGKLVVQGTGGQAGGLPNDVPSAGRSAPLLKQGFATVTHDGGHFSTITDTKWGYNNEEAQIDFAFRAPHTVTLASKAILERVLGRRPARSYYVGCSNGGREAMAMAQRFPWDFDGVIAGAPSIATTDLILNLYWASELLRDQSRSGFDMTAAKTLHAGVMAQCDKLDGKIDGVLDDPRQCKVDLKPLLCKDGPAEACLTEHQADIARKMYAGPQTPEGKVVAASSAYPGSEISWINFITPRWSITYGEDLLRYSAFSPPAGPGWKPDISKIGDYAKRMGVGESLAGAQNPDLRRFKANGGKMIAYYGWTDAFGGARAITDYYETAERTMGGEDKTKDFFRLFMVPGMDHCGGGAGASVFDWVAALDSWVETGKAPDSVSGFHPGPEGKPEFTRDVAAYRSVKAK